MKKLILILFLPELIGFGAYTQQSVLQEYINTGLENNLALKQAKDSLIMSISDLKEAKGLYYPDVSLNARYTVANGGRKIPVGEIINPVYQNLTIINTNLGIPYGPYPDDIGDFNFYRPAEHDTRLQVIQPIFNPQIYFNQKIKNELIQAEFSGITTMKRFLVAEIKTAYWNYLKTLEVNSLIDNTRLLLEENIRVNQSLYDNDKITIDNIFRSKAELSKLEENKILALKQQYMAQSYFNFLLNRSLDTEIIRDTSLIVPEGILLEDAKSQALDNREELISLERYANAAGYATKLNKSGKYPTVLGAMDYGFQGEKYSFTRDDDFLLASVVLKWNIFQGFRNDAKIQKAKVQEDILHKKNEEIIQKIQLEVTDTWYGWKAAQLAMASTKQRVESSQRAFYIVKRKYAEGQASLIEFIDARTTMTTAEVNLIIARYDLLIRYASLEKATGTYIFEN